MGTTATTTFCTVQRVHVCYSTKKVWFSLMFLCCCVQNECCKACHYEWKKNNKWSPKQNAVIATPSSLLRKSFQRNLTLWRRKTWPLSLQFTYPRLFQKNMLKHKHQGSTRAFQTRHQKNNSLSSKDYITLTLDIFQVLTDQVSTAAYSVVQITR